MSYHYLLSFAAEKDGMQQIGCVVVKRNKPIRTVKDIDNATAHLKKDNGFNNVTLLSFSLLEGEI